MQKLYYTCLLETRFGDCGHLDMGINLFISLQRDTRKLGLRRLLGFSNNPDFVHWQDCGVAIPRGTDEEQDQFIFAGSKLF